MTKNQKLEKAMKNKKNKTHEKYQKYEKYQNIGRGREAGENATTAYTRGESPAPLADLADHLIFNNPFSVAAGPLLMLLVAIPVTQ